MRLLAVPLLILATAAGAEQTELDPQEVQWAMAAAKRIESCGFTRAEPFFDEGQREVVVTVRDVVKASDRQLTCAARESLATKRYFLMPETLQPRYDAIFDRLEKEQALAEARPWLATRGLLDRVPQYDPTRDEEATFMRKLGELCGIDVAGALDPSYGPRTISMEWLERQTADDQGLACLWRAGLVSDFKTSLPAH